jgi:hypothetical protein
MSVRRFLLQVCRGSFIIVFAVGLIGWAVPDEFTTTVENKNDQQAANCVNKSLHMGLG